MDKIRISQLKTVFDEISHFITSDDGKEQVEVWFARELIVALGYARWENFQVAIGRAVESCKTQNINVDDHFREVTKMIEIGKDIKKLERRVAAEEKQIEKASPKLPKNKKNNNSIFLR